MSMEIGSGCKGYCRYFEGVRKRVTEVEYANGFKFCGKCQMGYLTNDRSCECCGYNMRIHTRTNSSYTRKKIREQLISPPLQELVIRYG